MAANFNPNGERRMRAVLYRCVATVAAVSALSACVTSQQQADGSHKFTISMPKLSSSEPEAAKPAPAVAAAEPVKAPVAPALRATTNATPVVLDAAARQQLEQALSCAPISNRFEQAGLAIRNSGWDDGGIDTVITLAEPLKVYGFNTRKVMVWRNSDEQRYRGILSGVSLAQVVKAARLKPGKDGKAMRRVNLVSILKAESENGQVVLTCTVAAKR
jgi:hypothetical protein